MTQPEPAAKPGQFSVLCCRARRSVLSASGVLVCMACDSGLHIPNRDALADVPAGTTRWPPA